MVGFEQIRQEIILDYKEQGFKNRKTEVDSFTNSVYQADNAQAVAETSSKRLQATLLGTGLSFLFTGMAIKRVADSMLKDLTTTYSKIMGENTIFNEQTNKLGAAFTFLKFSIFDALAQSELFTGLIDFLVNAVNWVSEFVAKHPVLTQMFIALLIGASLFGGAMMIAGQTGLFLLGVLTLLKFFGISTFAELTASAKGFFTASRLAALAWSAALVGLFGFVFFNWAEKVGGFGNFFKLVFAGLALIGATVADALVVVFTSAFDIILIPLNAIIRAYNEVAKVTGGKSISTISLTSSYLQSGGLLGRTTDIIMNSPYFAGALAGLQGAQQNGGNWGWLNPFSDGSQSVPSGTNTQLSNSPQAANVTNNNVNVNVEGLSPLQIENLSRTITEYLNEQGFLTGGSTQT